MQTAIKLKLITANLILFLLDGSDIVNMKFSLDS